ASAVVAGVAIVSVSRLTVSSRAPANTSSTGLHWQAYTDARLDSLLSAGRARRLHGRVVPHVQGERDRDASVGACRVSLARALGGSSARQSDGRRHVDHASLARGG